MPLAWRARLRSNGAGYGKGGVVLLCYHGQRTRRAAVGVQVEVGLRAAVLGEREELHIWVPDGRLAVCAFHGHPKQPPGHLCVGVIFFSSDWTFDGRRRQHGVWFVE